MRGSWLYGWEPVRSARPRVGGIDSALTVDLIEIFRLRVVRFELVVADRPRRREAAVVLDLTEIFFAKPEERRAIELGIPTHVIVRVGMERLPVLVLPHFFRVVLRVDVDGPRAPVVLFATDVVTAFEQQDPFARRSEMIGEGSAARACTDNDYVVMRHAGALIPRVGSSQR